MKVWKYLNNNKNDNDNIKVTGLVSLKFVFVKFVKVVEYFVH